MTVTSTDPPADQPSRGDAATDVEAGPPAAQSEPDSEHPAVVLTTDAEAQTDDPLINPNNS